MTTTTVSGSPVRADIRAAAGVNDSILAIGRILIALIFVSSGIEKFMDLGVTASAIESKGLPYPNILAVLTAILETGGGLLIILGWQTRLAALALVIFSAIAAYFFHDFWNQTGAQHTNNDSFHEECEHDRWLADAVRCWSRALFPGRTLHPPKYLGSEQAI